MMLGPVAFSLPGHPQGKGRARAFQRGGFIGHYTPEKTRSYEGMIRMAAELVMAGNPPTERPVTMTMTAVFDVPKSFSRARRQAALEGTEVPAKRPDIDNIAKAFLDAMNGVVFRDDAQIVDCRYSKIYGPAPMVRVVVTPL